MTVTRIAVLGGLIFSCAYGQTQCIGFPAGFVPFSSISYVTAADSAGDHLVVGVPAAGALSFIAANIPAPAFTNQTFCDAQVQLAPQQFYPNVYVPTAAELNGNFSAFAGLLTIPGTSQPYAGGIIPPGQLGNVFAWRIGPALVSANQGWGFTGSLPGPQTEQAAVLLPSGKVLIAGFNGTACLYDPATGRFTSTGQMAAVHGAYLTGTLLNNGSVLIVGGTNAPSAAELYDPVSGTFSLTGSPVYPHGFYGTATLLNDGRVLLVGGLTSTGFSGTADAGAETFDPATGKFTAAGPMNLNRAAQTATLLADGHVLIAGGSSPPSSNGAFVTAYDSAEIYDPSTGNFSLTGTMQASRSNFSAVLLPSGQVMMCCGFGSFAQSAELYDPASGSFTFTGETLVERSLGTATLLPSGQVLIAGGYLNSSASTNEAELYNPAAGTFAATGSMVTARANQSATLLLNGTVLVAGGSPYLTVGSPLTSAELYTP
jgi:hypothetical protein